MQIKCVFTAWVHPNYKSDVIFRYIFDHSHIYVACLLAHPLSVLCKVPLTALIANPKHHAITYTNLASYPGSSPALRCSAGEDPGYEVIQTYYCLYKPYSYKMLHIPVVMETLMACLQLGVGDCEGGEA